MRLNSILPPDYRCGLKIHLGSLVELDIGTFEFETGGGGDAGPTTDASLAWTATAPTTLLDTDELTPPE